MLNPMSLLLIISLLLLDLVSAAPHQALEKRTFRVNRYHSKGSPNAAQAMRKAFNKWGFALPEGLVPQSALGNVNSINPTGQTGSVVNTPEANDIEYLSPITVGGQELVMNFDTGSSDLWFFSTLLPAEDRGIHALFDPAKSSTFKEIEGASYSIVFGDQSFSKGTLIGTDVVDIGGAKVNGQTVQLASTVSSQFVQDQASDGIVGLGFSAINTVEVNGVSKPQKTFFENVLPSLKEPVFAAQLKKQDKGFYEFGKVDTTAFTGELTKVPVDSSKGFWQIESEYFQVGDGPVFHNPAAHPAIADTGTTLLLVDDIVAEKYYAQVAGARLARNTGMYSFPCNAALPDFHLGLGPEYRATISGALMNFQEVSAGNSPTKTVCIGAMQPNQGSPIQIYGDVLFKAQFAVFNLEDKTIGFADHA